MDQIPLVTSSTLIPLEKFWSSVLVYHDRPHLVNRKLVTVSPLLFCEISLFCPKIKHVSEIFTRESLLYEIRKVENLSSISPELIRKITDTYDNNAVIEETNWDAFQKSFEGKFISMRLVFARKGDNKCVEVVIFDKEKRVATFFAIQEQDTSTVAPRFPYHIELTQCGNLRILLNTFEDAETSSAEWLADKLFPKLLKWVDFDENIATKSLSLIAPDEYCTLYSNLKSKYGENLVKNWSQKTKTDPQKYIFEDIAIATYLICLWHKIGAENVNFVDCGCGNGLLVYILNQEGYKGCGFDIRRRKVWDIYEDKADLKVGIVTPESQFPAATWIIGNHSDELTPWIPIIALNSSPHTNFFVLPCCSYELNGQKYVRVNTTRSQYQDYLDYIGNISGMCGFVTSVDRLRIPSTRRICLVGIREKCKESELIDIKQKVLDFVKTRTSSRFIPRDAQEKVRNCTKLEKDLMHRIIKLVVKELLEVPCYMDGKFDGTPWNKGGSKSLSDLIQKISVDDKQSLKNECGGLQTLLKNHRYIFDVRNGSVTLRAPMSLKENSKYQDKPCWFQQNHPDGCFFLSEICAYKHIDEL